MRTQDEMVALAEAAWKLPCEAVHPAGAPCFVCNPQKTEEGYSNAPYYYGPRLLIAASNLRRQKKGPLARLLAWMRGA